MAEYKGIKGFKVQSLDADPVPAVAGWASGGTLNTGRSSLSLMGTQDAGLAACGYTTAVSTAAEEYNGATWTTVSSTSTGLYGRSDIGIQTAAVVAGGTPPQSPNTELYNGTTWSTNPSGLNASRASFGSAGVTAAAAIFGGIQGASNVGTTEEWNGSTWSTSPGSMSVARRTMGGTGTQTAALCFGGQNNPPSPTGTTDSTEEYDGTSWTAGGNLPTVRAYNRGAGTQSSTLGFGGSNPSGNISDTILYNGTSWSTTSGTLGTPRTELGGAGTSTLSLAAGGGSSSTATEEYIDYSPYANQIVQNLGQVWYNTTTKALKYTGATSSSWATSGTMNTARYFLGASGNQTDTVAFGGTDGAVNLSATEEYNGASWTSVTSLPTGITQIGGLGISSSAALAMGGFAPYLNTSYEYNGTSWSSGGTMATGRTNPGGIGTQTAGLAMGGLASGGNTNTTEEYDGSTWTAGGSLNRSPTTNALQGSGIQTAGLSFGGASSGTITEEYNGSTWTTVNSMNIARNNMSGAGTLQTAGIGFSGSGSTATEVYNGTNWSTDANVNTSRSEGAGSGAQGTALFMGGQPVAGATEEYDPGGLASIKTVTVI